MQGISLSGVLISTKELEALLPVLKSWIETVVEYSKLVEGDVCWWYNERANISVLAGATWRVNGWAAIEEFSTQKHSDLKAIATGRCDLFITNTQESFAIEAKQAWQKIGKRVVDKYNTAKTKFNESWVDASKLSREEGGIRLGACFISPTLPLKDTTDEDYKDILLDWINGLQNELNADALAWVFPESARLQKSDERVFPGACLALKIRYRAARRRSAL